MSLVLRIIMDLAQRRKRPVCWNKHYPPLRDNAASRYHSSSSVVNLDLSHSRPAAACPRRMPSLSRSNADRQYSSHIPAATGELVQTWNPGYDPTAGLKASAGSREFGFVRRHRVDPGGLLRSACSFSMVSYLRLSQVRGHLSSSLNCSTCLQFDR